jgi:signal peptidase I
MRRRGPLGVAPYGLVTAVSLAALAGCNPSKATKVEAFRLKAGSMEPSYMAGDYIMAITVAGPPARGQVVLYRTPDNTYLKRVVAIPGDTVAMSEGRLSIDGIATPEPYARLGDPYAADPPFVDSSDYRWQLRYLAPSVNAAIYHPSMHDWGPLLVPRGEYFMLGDNRDESMDSRFTGFVPAGEIVARPAFIYMSYDSVRRSVRWRRIGLKPR